MPPLAGILPAIGAWASANAAALGIGAAGIAAGAGQGYLSRRSAEKAQAKSLETWQENAYPNQAAIDAQATENRGALGQARAGAYQNLASNLAARGFGAGSGIGYQGGADIEKGYLQSFGKMQTDLTKFKNTPQFGMPGSAYPTATPGGLETGLGIGGSMMDKAMGYYMMGNLFKNVNNYPRTFGYGY